MAASAPSPPDPLVLGMKGLQSEGGGEMAGERPHARTHPALCTEEEKDK